jgi:hypothetical protein
MESIREVTNYYAKAGRSNDVLEQRLKVTRIRLRLGLPEGTIFRRVDGEGPDARWECEFSTREEYDNDRAAREASADFVAARGHMHEMLVRFERHVETRVDRAIVVTPEKSQGRLALARHHPIRQDR